MAKGRWLDREILEVVSTEFRDRSIEYYVCLCLPFFFLSDVELRRRTLACVRLSVRRDTRWSQA